MKETEPSKSRPPQGSPASPSSPWRALVWVFVLSLLFLWMFNQRTDVASQAAPISYSRFRQELRSGNVERVTIEGNRIVGSLEEAVEVEGQDGESGSLTRFQTYLPSFGDEELLSMLEAQEVEIETRPESDLSWWPLLLSLLPFVFFVGLIYLLSRQLRTQGRGIFSMGKSRAKLYDRRRERTTFSDVAGASGAKRELTEIIEFLSNPARFRRMGGAMPKGVLLIGPPGTGKTMLARAVAGEADVPFFSITGSDFMEMFVGVGASRVRDLFSEAKRSAPSIIFIDELDSIGRRRGAGLGGGHDEREQTLNQLLSEMDGFEPNEGVVVMAATNRPDILDPALLRPGRFDRRITVDLPTLKDRIEILEIHARNKPLAPGVEMDKIARGTPGFSGADLANLLNEGALLAARKNKQHIEEEDLEEARDKVVMGLARENLALTDKECELLAYHEAGHAVVAAVLPHADPIRKVTIVPRGRSMGHTEQLPERERFIYEKEYMLDRLAVMMGGRVSEELFLDTSTSGAENDLKEATRLARRMVLDWGMGKKLSRVALGGEQDEVFLGQEIGHRREYSEVTAREVDEEITAILGQAYEKAKKALLDHREGLKRLVGALREREMIGGDEVLQMVGAAEKKRRMAESPAK